MAIQKNIGIALTGITSPVLSLNMRDMNSSYPTHGLTPQRLSTIFKEADSGDIYRQAELYEEMEEKDAHLGSVLQTRKLAVSGLDYDVVPATSGREDEKIAGFIKEAISRVANWEDFLLDMMDAVGKGFSVSEIIYVLEGRSLWVSELRHMHQKRFTFMSKLGVMRMPRLLTEAQQVYGEDLTPNKFVVHTCNSRSAIAPRAGVLRQCAYLYLFKNYTLKDWVIFNERYAMPMRVGKYTASSSEQERTALKQAVYNMGADAAAVISDSTVIELLDSAGKNASAEVYERLSDFCNSSMSKAVLGHTGSADSTPGKLGNENEARDVRQDIIEADARSVMRSINTQLIKPLVAYNFGHDKRLPVFRLKPEIEEDLKTLSQTYKTISDMGVEVPASFVYRKFGIPTPEDEKEKR